jgi:Family of unknown function (DUF6069)
MATTIAPAFFVDTASSGNTQSTKKLGRAGVGAGLVAAAATTAVAAVSSAAGVTLEVGGEAIPLAGFAQMTLLGVVLGVVLAAALRRWAATPRRTFTTATVGLTVVSLGPDLAVSASTTTKLVLMATHLVAAAIVIPGLARCLPQRRS